MAIFSRRDSAASPSSPASSSDASSSSSSAAAQRRRVTHIAPGTRIEGRLAGATELLIEGEVEGEIRVEASVMIGNEGVVQGPVTAQFVRVSGRVLGAIQAAERIEVAPSGSVEGDMSAPRVIIAEGAFFKGRVEMKGERAEKERERDRDRERQRGERGNDLRRPKNGDTVIPQRTPSEPGS